ncbi:DUF2235 domain-containing protein [Arthrobacter liuii]|uniref:T6SS Phospholipase effector Tle1-like catalytic domain-containing protein n=1 Tax=Arthrobacter liuii TaxID=1476996 RepID=A0ABQ2ALP6_9MICC|nr:DUF2235 domain-containing protein [Arthrobacter liuii]GGH93399.1 hypothetical protein GCM10007170_14190 [Arthrobacter liuii]
MTKRIIVCCDGTWATPDQTADGQPCPTNVTKLALGIDAVGRNDNGRAVEQRVFYHRGVGTGRQDRIGGGAFGAGLSHDVLAAYRYIMGNFQPGDELFLLGFSRGAYTARSTAGLIRNAGILRRRFRSRLTEAYALYRDRTPTTNPRSVEATLFRRSFSHETRIHCIAVWDTVGALGIPLTGVPIIDRFNNRWAFHDADLSTSVDNAFQALAIDEKRKPFAPALWHQQDGAGSQRLEQVWFTGTHGDVGGGNRSTSLSDIALEWIVDRARSCGLVFRPDAFTDIALEQAGDWAPIQESRTGFWRLLPAYVRPMGTTDPAHERVSESALKRHEDDPNYRPPNLTRFLENGPPARFHSESGPEDTITRSATGPTLSGA